jgi:hypothetical protein
MFKNRTLGALSAGMLIIIAFTAQAEDAKRPAPQAATAAADLTALKKTRLADLQQRLATDQGLSQEDRANLEKLVARLKAELAASPTAVQQQSKLN